MARNPFRSARLTGRIGLFSLGIRVDHLSGDVPTEINSGPPRQRVRSNAQTATLGTNIRISNNPLLAFSMNS
jgi:hypothetical protein